MCSSGGMQWKWRQKREHSPIWTFVQWLHCFNEACLIFQMFWRHICQARVANACQNKKSATLLWICKRNLFVTCGISLRTCFTHYYPTEQSKVLSIWRRLTDTAHVRGPRRLESRKEEKEKLWAKYGVNSGQPPFAYQTIAENTGIRVNTLFSCRARRIEHRNTDFFWSYFR